MGRGAEGVVRATCLALLVGLLAMGLAFLSTPDVSGFRS